jgi:DNA-directed RNA polymerase subunit beta'
MGYIDLTCPITHLWYLKGVPNYLCILLRSISENICVYDIEEIVYFKDPKKGSLREQGKDPNPLDIYIRSSKTEVEKNELKKFFRPSYFNPEHGGNNNKQKKGSKMEEGNDVESSRQPYFKEGRPMKRRGSEIVRAALESIDIPMAIKVARSSINNGCLSNLNQTFIPEKSVIRRIRILESFLSTNTNPAWMVLTTLPVLPPNLRPLLELESGRLVAADINEIYRLIITRNQRLCDFLYSYTAPDLITVHGRKLLQEGIDSLIDNARLPKDKMFCLNNKALKSLTEILEGKQGRFRQSLLGKRVDYSGRSVIIVGPNLRLNQCGLPYEMATELFQPFLINELLKTKIKAPSHNTKLAQIIIKKNKPFVWTLLTKLTKKYSILLNRAPTLHRFGIQAFDPIIILGQAIHLHPLVCTGFNADFDGDQMAVHLPLYESSQLEARTMMRPSYNVLSPSNGDVILKPTQDMVIGCYYLTLMVTNNSYHVKKWFGNEKEVLSAFYQKKITIHTPVLVRYSLKSFQILNEDDKIIFTDEITRFTSNNREIKVLKTFQIDGEWKKYYLITTIGIFITRYVNEDYYEITDLFLETTPGRLIFSNNFKNSI